jgi:LmbE family N-acetylglucosaminyl deacetylase
MSELDLQPLRGKTVLAVFAHPDDESLACGGTLARLSAEGTRVVLMCATHGERGSQSGPARDDALGRSRAQEMRAAAAALGITDLILLDHPDGDLRWAHVSELHAEIVAMIRRHTPAAVLTFGEDGLYWHMDHVGVFERTTTAVRSLGSNAPALYYVTMPVGIMRAITETARLRGWSPPAKGFWSLVPDAFGILANAPTVTLDVRPWVPQKLAAILCHQSQMGLGHPFEQLDLANASRLLGIEQFHRADAVGSGSQVLELLGQAALADRWSGAMLPDVL